MAPASLKKVRAFIETDIEDDWMNEKHTYVFAQSGIAESTWENS